MIKKYTTLQWIWFWAMITIVLSWISQQTLASWTFYILVAGLIIGVLGWGKSLKKWIDLKRTALSYYIPQNTYLNKKFIGAPDSPSFPKTLTVGIGTYRLLLAIKTRTDVNLEPFVLKFEGEPIGIPQNNGPDHGFLFERLPNNSYRDWHGVNIPQKGYPYPLRRRQFLRDCFRIETTTHWVGKLRIQVPIKEKVIERCLDFKVETSYDDIPFLKIPESGSSYLRYGRLNQAGTSLP